MSLSRLPCRKQEKAYIKEFITTGLSHGGSTTSLYISGMPGTGKTATTLRIIEAIKKPGTVVDSDSDGFESEYPSFKFIKVNGMALSKPHDVYTILCQRILGKKVRPATAAVALEDFFKNKRRNTSGSLIIILLDELDALITK